MTQTIEQPQAKIAELEAEVERLKRTNSSYANLTKAQESQLTNLRQRLYQLKGADSAIDSERQANCDLTEQLAAEQLNNKLLRKALKAVIKVHGYESGIPVEAISTPASTEALDKYVAEKVKEATTGHVEDIRFKNKEVEELRRIKMSRFNNEDCWIYQGDGEDHLESLSCPVVVYPSVLIELTRQRDLAVEALKKALRALIHASAHVDNEDFVKVMMARDTINETLSTIKESEAK